MHILRRIYIAPYTYIHRHPDISRLTYKYRLPRHAHTQEETYLGTHTHRRHVHLYTQIRVQTHKQACSHNCGFCCSNVCLLFASKPCQPSNRKHCLFWPWPTLLWASYIFLGDINQRPPISFPRTKGHAGSVCTNRKVPGVLGRDLEAPRQWPLF